MTNCHHSFIKCFHKNITMNNYIINSDIHDLLIRYHCLHRNMRLGAVSCAFRAPISILSSLQLQMMKHQTEMTTNLYRFLPSFILISIDLLGVSWLSPHGLITKLCQPSTCDRHGKLEWGIRDVYDWDAYKCQWTGSALVQVMAWHQTVLN